jgi:O-antigen ligase
LLALLAGCGAFFYSRFGAMRAGLLAAAGIPVLLAGFGGRQTNIAGAMTGGTGATRVELWSEGLQLFKTSPIFGIGHKMYNEEVGQVAHNSFLHAYTELGLVGGIAFLGLFAILGWTLWKLRDCREEMWQPGIRHMLPYMSAMLFAYCVSMMSLSRSYGVPTYLAAGIGTCYVTLAQAQTSFLPVELNGRVLRWLAVASVGFIGFVYVYIQLLVRMG